MRQATARQRRLGEVVSMLNARPLTSHLAIAQSGHYVQLRPREELLPGEVLVRGTGWSIGSIEDALERVSGEVAA